MKFSFNVKHFTNFVTKKLTNETTKITLKISKVNSQNKVAKTFFTIRSVEIWNLFLLHIKISVFEKYFTNFSNDMIAFCLADGVYNTFCGQAKLGNTNWVLLSFYYKTWLFILYGTFNRNLFEIFQ